MKGKVKRFAVVLLTAAMALNSAGMATFADTIRVSTPSAADKVLPGESTDGNKAQKEKLKTAYMNKATSSDAVFNEDCMPSTDPDNPWGVIRIEGGAESNGWYTDPDLTITIENSKNDESGNLIETKYKLWNNTVNPDGVQNEAIAEGTASKGTGGNSTTIILSDKFLDCTEGIWKLEVWNQSSADPSNQSKKYVKTFQVDSVAPTVETVPEEVKVVNASGLAKIINILSFGVFCNEALEVKVKVVDEVRVGDGRTFEACSLDDTLFYSIETENGVQEGKTMIEMNPEWRREGYATFRLPIGTRGKITMWATDGAGNSSKGDSVKLSVKKDDMDVTNWVLENIAPEITATTPEDLAENVDPSANFIRLSFSEDVTPVPGKTVSIFAGRERYVYFLTEEDKEQISGTDAATFLLEEFVNLDTGKPLTLKDEAVYRIEVDDGAFIDLAGNPIAGGIVSLFTTGEMEGVIKPPVIDDVDENFQEGIGMLPEFASDKQNYVLIVIGKALDEAKSYLAEDLVLDVLYKDDLGAIEAVLEDFEGNQIDSSLPVAMDGDKIHITVGNEQIRSGENYILKVTVSNYKKEEETYSFFISTSAVTANVRTTDGAPSVTLDPDALLSALQESDLADLVAESRQVSIQMEVSALPVSSVQKELAAMQALRDAKGESRNAAFYPMDFTINKYASDELVDKIAELGEAIPITMKLPEGIDKVEGFYRYHDDQAFSVPFTIDEESKSITFEADQFSVYAAAYPYTEPDSGEGDEDGSDEGDEDGSGEGDEDGSGGSDEDGSGGSGEDGSGGSDEGGSGGDDDDDSDGNNDDDSDGGRLTSGNTYASTNGAWINDGWVFVKADGQKAASEWININGKIYRFTADGFLDRTYRGLNYAADGSLVNPGDAEGPVINTAGVWLKDGWWYRTADGKALKGGWYYLLCQGRFDWYYFDSDGWMLDGWLDENGKRYYLHTVYDGTRGRMYEGWNLIDGKWYYFCTEGDEGTVGSLVRGGQTPDGHTVDADGAWDGHGTTPVAKIRRPAGP